MNKCFPAKFSRGEKKKEKACVCESMASFCSNIYVEMDGGDVMSGIDPLNMAPSHHKDDVIRKERQKQNSCYLML